MNSLHTIKRQTINCVWGLLLNGSQMRLFDTSQVNLLQKSKVIVPYFVEVLFNVHKYTRHYESDIQILEHRQIIN